MPSPRNTSPAPSRRACTSFLNDRSMAYYRPSGLHMRGQPGGQDREADEDHEPDQVGDDERNNTAENGRESDVLHHALDDEDDHADRRVNEAKLDRHDDDDAEPDRIE